MGSHNVRAGDASVLVGEVVATRNDYKLNGKIYKRGEIVDVSGLSDRKIGQLLSQRQLAPKVEDEDPTV